MNEQQKPSCSICRYYEQDFSECRRTSPFEGGWPSVKVDEWCGKFEAKRQVCSKCDGKGYTGSGRIVPQCGECGGSKTTPMYKVVLL